MTTPSGYVANLLAEKRFYVFFADGSWCTATTEEWQTQRMWERKIEATGWVGGELTARVFRTLARQFE